MDLDINTGKDIHDGPLRVILSETDEEDTNKQFKRIKRNQMDNSFKNDHTANRKVTVVAGDSILKNIHGWRLYNPNNHACGSYIELKRTGTLPEAGNLKPKFWGSGEITRPL